MRLNRPAIRRYVDFFLPREVIGPIILAFAIENVVNGLFHRFMPGSAGLYGWAVIAVVAALLVKEWGEAEEDAPEPDFIADGGEDVEP